MSRLTALAKAWRDEANEPRFPAEEDRDAVEAYDKVLRRCADELDAALQEVAP